MSPKADKTLEKRASMTAANFIYRCHTKTPRLMPMEDGCQGLGHIKSKDARNSGSMGICYDGNAAVVTTTSISEDIHLRQLVPSIENLCSLGPWKQWIIWESKIQLHRPMMQNTCNSVGLIW